jgi:hypothetical protein
MLKQSNHENNKVIAIKSKLPIAHEAQKELEEWFKETRRSIGSYYRGGGSKKSGSGMETWEEDIVMPIVLGMQLTDKDYRGEVDLYFTNMNTRVPYPEGAVLQVGMTEDNDKPLTFKDANGEKVINTPLNIEDYIKYRHATKHPEVAPSEDDKGATIYKYYIEDKNLTKLRARKGEDLVDTALEYFLDVRRTPKEVAMHLTLLGTNYTTIDKEDRGSKLKSLILEGKAEAFITNYKDADNLIKFDISNYVRTKVITKEGSRYIFDGEQLGVSEKDFVEFIKDENNNHIMALVKARYQELRK